MKIEIHNRVSDFNSYRAQRVKSLFNAENGCNFDLVADLDLEGLEWTIGVVVGPSGSGKTSIGKKIFPGVPIHDHTEGWSDDKPIVEDIAREGSFDEVTGSLAAVGLGDVPAWLRPFRVLSNGEQFRAGLARLVCEKPEKAVVDEFTSVVDRQIAKIGSQAFQKSWRRGNKGKRQVVLLTPHYDVLDWLNPDWVFDTKDKKFIRGWERRRPPIEVEVIKTNSSYWRYFKPHYYLDLPHPVAAEFYVGTVDGELVSHLAVTPMFNAGGYRATRLVTMPEWQGAGVGFKFLEKVCQLQLEGYGRKGKKLPTFFHTSHPQLITALKRSKRWIQTSAKLHGSSKKRNAESLIKSSKAGRSTSVVAAGAKTEGNPSGYGGHFRPVQGFKYIGDYLINKEKEGKA